MAVSSATSVKSENKVTDNVVDWDDVISEIDAEMKRLGWTVEQGQQHLIQMYGVKSRVQLSDSQIWDFLDYLKSQSRFKVGETDISGGESRYSTVY